MLRMGFRLVEGRTVISFWITYEDLGLVIRERGPRSLVRRDDST